MNQDGLAKGSVLSSMLKRVDNATYDTIKNYLNKELVIGREIVLGLKEKGVGLTNFEYCDTSVVTPAVKSKIKEAEQKIIDGKITVTDASAVKTK